MGDIRLTIENCTGIELSEYTPRVLQFIRGRKLACVYVVAIEGRAPCKFGFTRELTRHVTELQRGNPRRITVECALWTPGPMIAITLKNSAQIVFQNKHMAPDWYDVEPQAARNCLMALISTTFPTANIKEHSTLIGHLASGAQSLP